MKRTFLTILLLLIFGFCENKIKANEGIVLLARKGLNKAFENIKNGKIIDGFPLLPTPVIHYDIPKEPLCKEYKLKDYKYFKKPGIQEWYVYFHCPGISESDVEVNILLYFWSSDPNKEPPFPTISHIRQVMFGRMKYRDEKTGRVCQDHYIKCLRNRK